MRKEEKSPLRIFLQIVSKDGSVFNLEYESDRDVYKLYLKGFQYMMIEMSLLQFSKLAFQLGLQYFNDERNPETAFQNKQILIGELKTNRQACEVADIISDEVLIYLPGNEIQDGYFIRKSDRLSISPEELVEDGTFFIAPFIPDYLLNEAPEPQNLLEQNDEEAFIRGYQAALSQFDSFIYEQRRRFNKPGELAEAMVNTKGTMLY